MSRKYLLPTMSMLGIVMIVYRYWFLAYEIVGGDWPYYYSGFLQEITLMPSIWSPVLSNGMGGINPLLGLYMFSASLIVPFVQWFQIPWVIVYKFGWFGLFLILSAYSIHRLIRIVYPDANSLISSAGMVIYLTNTYILMIASGGQMGIAISYAIAPLVLATFISFIQQFYTERPSGNTLLKSLTTAGLVFSLQIMLDLRIAYISGIALLMYLVILFVTKKMTRAQLIRLLSYGLFYIVIVFGMNAYWIVPLLFVGGSGLEQFSGSLSSTEAVKYYSFASFDNAISLMHPNWPENIFGKTGFMRPEFLFIPILAYGGLLIKKSKLKLYIVFFSLLGLTGTFLAKGAQDPFGIVYVWMTEYIPGFILFRDPTKFYVLIAVSYALLIPHTLQYIRSKIQFNAIMSKCILLAIVFLWLFTIREALSGQLRGTFARHRVPQEYSDLASFLENKPDYFRVLWVPRQQRFAYSTYNHTSIESEPLFHATSSAELKEVLDAPLAIDHLEHLSIRYIAVPYDSLGELFLTDRKYDESKRREWEEMLDRIPWLTKIQDGPIALYETPAYQDKIWLDSGEPVSYTMIRPDSYTVSFSLSAPSELHFSEQFHEGWVFQYTNGTAQSSRDLFDTNTFILNTPGEYTGSITFTPQKYIVWGTSITIMFILGIIYVFSPFANKIKLL